MSDVRTVSDPGFEQEVLEATQPVLVDFWAPWCAPCRAVGPVLEEIARRYAGRVQVVKLNVDESPRTAERYGIRGIPTVALFMGGEMVDGIKGAAPLPHFAAMLDRRLMSVATSA